MWASSIQSAVFKGGHVGGRFRHGASFWESVGVARVNTARDTFCIDMMSMDLFLRNPLQDHGNLVFKKKKKTL